VSFRNADDFVIRRLPCRRRMIIVLLSLYPLLFDQGKTSASKQLDAFLRLVASSQCPRHEQHGLDLQLNYRQRHLRLGRCQVVPLLLWSLCAHRVAAQLQGVLTVPVSVVPPVQIRTTRSGPGRALCLSEKEETILATAVAVAVVSSATVTLQRKTIIVPNVQGEGLSVPTLPFQRFGALFECCLGHPIAATDGYDDIIETGYLFVVVVGLLMERIALRDLCTNRSTSRDSCARINDAPSSLSHVKRCVAVDHSCLSPLLIWVG